jgi:hypothetical protein
LPSPIYHASPEAGNKCVGFKGFEGKSCFRKSRITAKRKTKLLASFAALQDMLSAAFGKAAQLESSTNLDRQKN